MCIVKTPKVDPAASTPKPLPVLTNPLLDGITPTSGLRIGTSSLRIDRVGSAASAPVSTPAALAIPPTK